LTTHILVVPSWYSSGRGTDGGYFRDQALALAAAGHRVAIAVPAIHTWRDRRCGRVPPGRGETMVEADGVPVYRRNSFTALPRLPYRNPLVWAACGIKLAAGYIAENGRPDLVHAHSCLNAGVLALALERRYGIAYAVTEHSAGPATARWWERDLIRRVIKRANHRIAVSPHLAAMLERAYPGAIWHYLPNVLGRAFLAANPLKGLSQPTLPFVFLCVARLSPEKGHAVLFEAFARAFAGDGEVRLRLVGDGPARPGLMQLAHRYAIAAQVEFAGALPAERVRAEMEAADAFVLASHRETFGVAVIEALACGLPVVSTASGGPDHLIDSSNGTLVRCGDISALSAALLQMRRQVWSYDRFAIRAEAIRRCGPDAFVRQFAAIIG
jgi:teichuronic acid biosynthesis glycosyltransferase TuaC